MNGQPESNMPLQFEHSALHMNTATEPHQPWGRDVCVCGGGGSSEFKKKNWHSSP